MFVYLGVGPGLHLLFKQSKEETKKKVMALLFSGWGMQLGVGTGTSLRILRTAFYILQHVERC